MGKKTKKRLSCFLCAMLLFVTGIETSAFTGVFAATARKIDVWDFGAVQESDTTVQQPYQRTGLGTVRKCQQCRKICGRHNSIWRFDIDTYSE